MAILTNETTNEILNRCDIVEVISKYVALSKKGKNYFGLCPFHKEKTGSFAVSRNKQIYHCFGCGEGGNVIRFIMRVENIGFKEALEMLADKANITLPTIDYNNLNMSQAELIAREEKKKET